MGIYYGMARASTTADVFNAVAEPRRRELIETLADSAGPVPVGQLVRTLGLPQPAVSKHLAVLREVGLVSVTRRGRQRLYALNPQELRPMHDWTSTFERFWTNQLDRIKAGAERKAREPDARPHQ